MATSTTLTMSDVIDETLDYCHRYAERPAQIVIGSNAVTSTSDATFTLSQGTLSASDVVEYNQELMLVTGVSDDADPVYTVSRGYLGTTAVASIPTLSVAFSNPMYPRYQVQRAIERSARVLNKELPAVLSESYTRETDKRFVDLPANTIRVLEVGYMNLVPDMVSQDRYVELAGWEFVEDLPDTIGSGTTKILRTPGVVANDQVLIVKRQVPYTWSDNPTVESSTLVVPIGSEELPVLFATARLVSGREISRSELDKVEEWNHEAALRGGVNLRLMQALWADFYHAVEEAKAVQYVPRHRPFRRMPRLNSVRTQRWV